MSTQISGMVRSPKQDRSRAAVRRLLDAAEAAFAEQGYEQSSVRSIAARAGVPKGTLYQFFANKEAVLDAVVSDLLDEVDQIFHDVAVAIAEASAEQATPPPIESLVELVVSRLIDLASRRPAFRTLFSGLAPAGPLATAGDRVRERYRSHTQTAISHTGRSLPLGSEQASAVCTDITRGLLPSVVDERGDIDEQLAPELGFAVGSYLRSVAERSEIGSGTQSGAWGA